MPTRCSSLPSRARTGRRRGFTLVEVLVAMLVLLTGLVALAGATASALRLLAAARLEEDAAFLVARRLELLRATPCAQRADGDEATDRLVARWTVTPPSEGTATRIVVLVASRARPLDARRFETVAPC